MVSISTFGLRETPSCAAFAFFQARHHACDRLLGLQSSASRQERRLQGRGALEAVRPSSRLEASGSKWQAQKSPEAWTSPRISNFALPRHCTCLGPLFRFCELGQPATLVRPHAPGQQQRTDVFTNSSRWLHAIRIAASCCTATRSASALHGQSTRPSAIELPQHKTRSRCTSPGAPVYACWGPWCREQTELHRPRVKATASSVTAKLQHLSKPLV